MAQTGLDPVGILLPQPLSAEIIDLHCGAQLITEVLIYGQLDELLQTHGEAESSWQGKEEYGRGKVDGLIASGQQSTEGERESRAGKTAWQSKAPT